MAEAKTVLITGGDSALNAALSGLLLRRGHRVKVLASSVPDIPEKAQIVHIDGGVSSRSQVDVAMREVDIVVHVARDAGLTGTQHVIESAFAADVERFIHISSSAVFALPRLMPLESAPRNAKSSELRDLIAAEDMVISYRRKGMSVPVLRAQPLVGPFQHRNFVPLFEAALAGKGFALNGRGDTHYQLLDVDDLCAAVLSAMTGQRDMVNETYNLGARDYGTIRADVQAVLDHAGRGGQVTNRPFASSPVPGESIMKESVIDTAQAVAELGFAPQYSNAQALIRNYEWYAANKHRL